MDPDYLLRLLAVTLINVALSGDNVIVIGMAAASLPRTQRGLAIVGGGALAFILRAVLTAAASEVLTLPLVSAAGGLVLFWVAWRLLELDSRADGRDAVGKTGSSLREAVQIIVIADITMSLDNVIAVAGIAHGDVSLLVLSLLVSMPLLMATGGMVSMLINRFRWLVYLGAGAIGFTGARMIADAVLAGSLGGIAGPWALVISLGVAVAIPTAFHAVHERRRPSIQA